MMARPSASQSVEAARGQALETCTGERVHRVHPILHRAAGVLDRPEGLLGGDGGDDLLVVPVLLDLLRLLDLGRGRRRGSPGGPRPGPRRCAGRRRRSSCLRARRRPRRPRRCRPPGPPRGTAAPPSSCPRGRTTAGCRSPPGTGPPRPGPPSSMFQYQASVNVVPANAPRPSEWMSVMNIRPTARSMPWSRSPASLYCLTTLIRSPPACMVPMHVRVGPAAPCQERGEVVVGERRRDRCR